MFDFIRILGEAILIVTLQHRSGRARNEAASWERAQHAADNCYDSRLLLEPDGSAAHAPDED